VDNHAVSLGLVAEVDDVIRAIKWVGVLLATILDVILHLFAAVV
jgi:hypothetical protein